MRLKWNRKLSILVLIMFITVTFASFNTNLFIDGRAYVRADDLVRITNIELVENTNQAYETYEPEYTSDTITINTNLPKQNSTAQYRITITNNSDYDYDVQDIIEETYSNTKISYTITGLTVDDTVLEAHTTSTFLLTLLNNTTITEEPDVYETKTYEFDYTGDVQKFVVPYAGEYKIELWGASGGRLSSNNMNALGSYTSGIINLRKNQELQLYIGQSINGCVDEVVYNSGGKGSYNKNEPTNGGANPGGATDIRLVGGSWDKFESLKSRIMVAAGGAGEARWGVFLKGGSGGGLVGYSGGTKIDSGITFNASTGGTQFRGGYTADKTIAYNWGTNGHFGKSGLKSTYSAGWAYGSAGGSGYFGGGFGGSTGGAVGAGAGGSSYISGHPGCVSIDDSSTSSNIVFIKDSNGVACNNSSSEGYNSLGYNMDTACNKHYSGYYFTDTVMIDGNGYEWDENGVGTEVVGMPTHDGTSTMTGNSGNGYAKITLTRKIEDGSEYDFTYTGEEQTYTTPYTGIYKLETWGAQGGDAKTSSKEYFGGYGSYSKGKIELLKDSTLYINVGEQGTYAKARVPGTFNGGGSGTGGICNDNTRVGASGGGATHIATESGLLNTFEDKKDKILIASGGGGGAFYIYASYGNGSSAGGFVGNASAWTNNGHKYYVPATGGDQTTGGTGGYAYATTNIGLNGAFGQGGNYYRSTCAEGSGGGGGFYGGASCQFCPGAGGSGYIGNSLLTEKIMYCYNCEESKEIDTRTVSTKSHSKEPKKNIAKEGNGHSRITLVQRLSNNIELSLKFDIKRLTDYNITYDLAGGTISGQNDTYTRNTNNFTLPTPTKEGYTFVGWTGGKNLFDYTKSTTNSKMNNNMDGSFSIKTAGTGFTIGLTGNSSPANIVTPRLNNNETLTVSFEMKSEEVELVNSIFYCISTEKDTYQVCYKFLQNFGITSQYKRFSGSFKLTQDAVYSGIAFYPNNGGNNTSNLSIRNIQIEKGNYATSFEQYISTTQNLTVPKGSRGNRVYSAVWEPIDYDIEYDLNGGTITNEPTTYNISSNNITLPTPTKEGYFFAGWTGGKNLYNPNGHVAATVYGINNTINEDGSITSIGTATKPERWTVISNSYSVNKYITTGEQYTLSQKDSQNKINATTYIQINDLAKNSEDTNKYYYITNSNVTFTADDNYNHNIVVQTAKYGGAEVNITNYFQLEKGSKATAYEKYINVPQENLVIDSGSQGHRFYTANWETRGIGDYNILSGWVDGDTGEVLSGDPHDRYPDPYYTKIMKLTGGKTYTVQGGISGSDVRWRRYDLNGKYTTYVQGESFTPQSDCYVRVLLIQNVTESVKQNFSITETQ